MPTGAQDEPAAGADREKCPLDSLVGGPLAATVKRLPLVGDLCPRESPPA